MSAGPIGFDTVSRLLILSGLFRKSWKPAVWIVRVARPVEPAAKPVPQHMDARSDELEAHDERPNRVFTRAKPSFLDSAANDFISPYVLVIAREQIRSSNPHQHFFGAPIICYENQRTLGYLVLYLFQSLHHLFNVCHYQPRSLN